MRRPATWHLACTVLLILGGSFAVADTTEKDDDTGAYMIVLGEINDREALREHYVAHLAPLYEKFGGEYVAVGGDIEVLEGSIAPESMVVARWPSMAAARRFWSSPEYDKLRKARFTGNWGTFNVFLLPALPAATRVSPMVDEKGKP